VTPGGHPGDDAALERFLALEHAGWKGESGSSLRSNEAHEAFFRSLFARAAPERRISLWELADGEGRTVAMTTRLQRGDVEFDFKRTYDEELGSYSPGRLLELELLATLGDRGRAWVDTCLDPPDPFYERLTERRRSLADVVVVGRGLRTRAAHRLALRHETTPAEPAAA
jgi:CelD/BcsL family acetyltransferase involved in cellulose biosynthesis